MMNNNPSGWAVFLRHIRTPLGGIVALDIIALFGLPIIVFAPVDAAFRGGYIVFFIILVLGSFLFIVQRTPKTGQGLVATEELYALQSLFRHLKVYGDSDNPQTRQAAIESAKKMTSVSALPPPPHTESLEKGDESK